MTETRYTDPATGGEKGQKDARFGGGDPLALMELAKVYGMGEGKYARYNYLKGYPWSLSVDALYRHLFAFLAGEERDPESGLLHTAHVAWHALTLTSFQQRAVGTDDRAPGENVTVKTTEAGYAIYSASMEAGYARCDHRCDHGVPMNMDCDVCTDAWTADAQ